MRDFGQQINSWGSFSIQILNINLLSKIKKFSRKWLKPTFLMKSQNSNAQSAKKLLINLRASEDTCLKPTLDLLWNTWKNKMSVTKELKKESFWMRLKLHWRITTLILTLIPIENSLIEQKFWSRIKRQKPTFKAILRSACQSSRTRLMKSLFLWSSKDNLTESFIPT